MTDAEKAYQYFVIAVPENEERAKAYFWARKALQSTLTPPNEPLTIDKKRVIAESCLHYRESGRCGLNGYAPLDCPKCKEWQNNEPNEPLTLEQLRDMDGEPVWIEDVKHWALIDIEKGGQWDGVPFAVWAENGVKFTYNVESSDLHCYRRPPEGEEDT